MKLFILPLLSLLAAPAPARPGTGPAKPASPSAVITFHETAQVRRPSIRLGDIALVEGEDAALVRALEALEVGAAPLAGRSRGVSADYTKIRVRQLGIDPSRLLFSGASLVRVTQPDQVVPGSALEKAAREAVEALNPGAAAQVAHTPAELRLPEGALELKVHGAQALAGSSGSVTVEALVDSQRHASTTVHFRLLRQAPVVVAARDLPAGTVLTDADLRIELRAVTSGAAALAEVSVAVGQQAAVPVRTGAPLTAAMLKPAVLVRRGARVRLLCKGPSFSVTASGEALQDGAAGQPIRVRNLTSLLEVTGLVVGSQTVEVPF